MTVPHGMEGVGERGDDLVGGGHDHVHMWQDRQGPATGGGTRDENRTGLGDQRLARRDAGVAGFERVLVEVCRVDAIGRARHAGQKRLDERVRVPGHPVPIPLPGEREEIVAGGGEVGHLLHDRTELAEILDQELEPFGWRLSAIGQPRPGYLLRQHGERGQPRGRVRGHDRRP